LIAVAILLGSTFVAPTSAAAQEIHTCDLFSIDDAEQLVGQPIVRTDEGAEDSRFVCARYGDHAATLLEVTRYASADIARAYVQGGTTIAGLGDASSLVTSQERMVLLRVVKGAYLVSISVSLDDPPIEVTADDLAPRVQAVLDYLASQPVSPDASGCDPPAAAAIAEHLHHPDVAGVEIIGGCSYVAIATRLEDSGDAALREAQQICDKAAEVAYMDERMAISVTSKGRRELAIGIKGAPCRSELYHGSSITLVAAG
jgi:hypothetical protein